MSKFPHEGIFLKQYIRFHCVLKDCENSDGYIKVYVFGETFVSLKCVLCNEIRI